MRRKTPLDPPYWTDEELEALKKGCGKPTAFTIISKKLSNLADKIILKDITKEMDKNG